VVDVAFIAITIAFFLVCAGAVRLCDRIIGPDSDHVPVDERCEGAELTGSGR
jgi:hypothetical protein